ncbi:MAG: hypothetical protein A3J28_09880 [Acidobacteria bacterium RIFCSPLOWO2_12_FULL_60_22]|nr:MAG: hypothetical protein A3J28_09880 [Acidobacteria bacterium RIFCSPLOWO2_12_FULL_60_22]
MGRKGVAKISGMLLGTFWMRWREAGCPSEENAGNVQNQGPRFRTAIRTIIAGIGKTPERVSGIGPGRNKTSPPWGPSEVSVRPQPYLFPGSTPKP